MPLRLRARIVRHLPQMHETLQHDPFAHPVRQAAIHKAHQRHMLRKASNAQDVIDACTAGEDRLHICGAVEKLGVLLPNKGVIDPRKVSIRICQVCHVDDLAARKCSAKRLGHRIRREFQIDDDGAFHKFAHCPTASVRIAFRSKAAAISAFVYSSAGAPITCSAVPCSTTLPARMTMMSLASARTTFRSWLMKR